MVKRNACVFISGEGSNLRNLLKRSRDYNFPMKCFTLDLIQGCSSFPYAFFLANRYLNEKIFKNCLILSSETYRDYIVKKNRSCDPIFSDAASAIYIDNKTKIDVLAETYLTDGMGSKNLIKTKNKLFMNGPAIFFFTKKHVPLAVNDLLQKSKLNISEIDYFYFHQASKLVIDNLKSILKIPDSKVHYNLENIGNTVTTNYKNNSHWLSYLLILVFSLHSILEGLILGFELNPQYEMTIFIAIMAHKGAEALSLITNMITHGFSRYKTIKLI